MGKRKKDNLEQGNGHDEWNGMALPDCLPFACMLCMYSSSDSLALLHFSSLLSSRLLFSSLAVGRLEQVTYCNASMHVLDTSLTTEKFYLVSIGFLI